MRSIFFRIYIGILCAVLLIGFSAWSGYQYWNQQRLDRYLTTSTIGTLNLIAAGIQRHSGERLKQWIDLSRQVTGLKFELRDRADLPESATAVENTTVETNPLLLQHLTRQQRVLWLEISADRTQTRDTWLRLTLDESDINEQLMRGTQLLLLNELGRLNQSERPAALQTLQQSFPYPLHWLPPGDIVASYTQRRALARGDSVVIFETSLNQKTMRAMAPIGNSGDYLQLGPIPLSDAFPRTLILLAGMGSLLLLALACFLLVKPLEKRLGRMSTEVEQLDLQGDREPIRVEGDDALTGLAIKINSMSDRIRQLLQAQRDLNRAVSHELKTPLARLRFRQQLALQKLEQLASDSTDISAVESHLLGMDASLVELNHLVEEILLYASLESTAPKLNPTTIALTPMLERLIEPLANQFPTLSFSHNCDGSEQITADPHYLQRALQNLLNNAQRFADGNVEVRISHDDGWLDITVEDDGPGIPPAQWQQVLTPFYRVESSRNRQTGGTGLGLAIVDQIMQWHQGSVTISKARIGGAAVQLSLPLTDPPDDTN